MFSAYKKELKEMLPIGIPAILSQLAQMAMGFIDTIMAGHYSTDALAAIAIGSSLLQPVIVFFLGLFLAFNPIIAQFNGENQLEKVKSHFNASIVIALAMSPIAIIAIFSSPVILAMLGIERQVSLVAEGYLLATQWGMPALLLFFALRFCNEGLFSTKAIMIITALSIPLNVAVNFWFIYGGFGVPELGAVGVGYATALIWILMFFGLLIYTILVKKYRFMKLLRSSVFPKKDEYKAIFALGLPLGITLGFEVTMFAAVSLMIARYPVEIMAAHQIALNLASLTFMIPLGLSQAITARVSYFRGKKQYDSMKIAGNTGILVSISIMTISALIMISIPALLVSIYTKDPQLLQLAASLLFFAAVFQFSDGLQVASAGCLRGLKDTKIPMIITAIAYWLVGFPTGYFLAEYADLGVEGYWIGLIIGLTTAAILLLRRWLAHSQTQNKQLNT